MSKYAIIILPLALIAMAISFEYQYQSKLKEVPELFKQFVKKYKDQKRRYKHFVNNPKSYKYSPELTPEHFDQILIEARTEETSALLRRCQ